MTFDLWGFTGLPFLRAPAGLFGYVLVGLYALGWVVTVVATGRSLRQLTRRQWLQLGLLGLAGVLLSHLFEVSILANILPPPGVPAESQRPGFAPLLLIPAFLAGGWLGVAPALLVGLVTGFAYAAWETHSFATPFELAFIAGVVAWGLRQEYRGLPGRVLRHPLLASLVVAVTFWPLLIFSYYAYAPRTDLPAWDYVWSLTQAASPVLAGEIVLAGLVAEIVRWGWPQAWPVRRGLYPPPYLASLNRKLLFTLIPLFVVGIAFLFGADLTIATTVSTDLTVQQMIRVAQQTGQAVPYFTQSGFNLLQTFAAQDSLTSDDVTAQTTQLTQNLEAMPFFRQLTLVDPSLTPRAGYPTAAAELPAFTAEEAQYIQLAMDGIPQNVTVYPTAPGDPVDVLFIVPVSNANGQITGALLGRADLASNPFMQVVSSNLTNVAEGAGHGFLVDERNIIIFHPDPTQQLDTFEPPAALNDQTLLTYEDKAPDGTRRLVVYYPIPGNAWSVVVMVPNQVVLALATQISTPILLILLVIGLLGIIAVSLIALRLTRPAEALAAAAQRLSEGELSKPVVVAGEDEIGRAGLAFERMRQKLRARLDELGLLLRVSQSVAGSLKLTEALPPILEGALSATGAAGARIVLLPADKPTRESPGNGLAERQVFASGTGLELMALLDRGVVHLAQNEGQVALENLARARAVLDVSLVVGQLHALVALPLRQENTYLGVLWLGYTAPHTFSAIELDFLTTLAGQAAVAVANTRLFDSAEQGRQRLAAILASTPDAVIVTDRNERVLLLNPAAETAFDLANKPSIGLPVAQVLPHIELVDLLTNKRPTVDGAPPANTLEFENTNGRTLYASASTIISGAGAPLGRVCVLRDVTHFKELDLMKSEFVATVSHDLRAPLTFMRGYATMLPMVGSLNDKQREFGEKIITGIEQMTELIDDLLDLGRIEAGVGLAREAVHLNELVNDVVHSLTPHAANKGLRVSLEVPPALPLISGDPTLLRQAMQNFVENAIKYTPSGGEVRVRATMDEHKFQFAVTDTGVGITPPDQVHLFEKFFRVKQRGSTQVKGSGLGLAIVKSIVERHGGRVWVESKLGKGSTFFFEVPRLPVEAEPPNKTS